MSTGETGGVAFGRGRGRRRRRVDETEGEEADVEEREERSVGRARGGGGRARRCGDAGGDAGARHAARKRAGAEAGAGFGGGGGGGAGRRSTGPRTDDVYSHRRDLVCGSLRRIARSAAAPWAKSGKGARRIRTATGECGERDAWNREGDAGGDEAARRRQYDMVLQTPIERWARNRRRRVQREYMTPRSVNGGRSSTSYLWEKTHRRRAKPRRRQGALTRRERASRRATPEHRGNDVERPHQGGPGTQQKGMRRALKSSPPVRGDDGISGGDVVGLREEQAGFFFGHKRRRGCDERHWDVEPMSKSAA